MKETEHEVEKISVTEMNRVIKESTKNDMSKIKKMIQTQEDETQVQKEEIEERNYYISKLKDRIEELNREIKAIVSKNRSTEEEVLKLENEKLIN